MVRKLTRCRCPVLRGLCSWLQQPGFHRAVRACLLSGTNMLASTFSTPHLCSVLPRPCAPPVDPADHGPPPPSGACKNQSPWTISRTGMSKPPNRTAKNRHSEL